MKRFECLLALSLIACSGSPARTEKVERTTSTPAVVTPAKGANGATAGESARPAPSAAPVVVSKGTTVSTLRVKRLLVTSGVQEREPLAVAGALPSDGTPIYAFAELDNPNGASENIRITFERKGGSERVGNVTLPVPGKVSRHRTWATTRFIRAAGVWEAVLWSESGRELERTSFEVSEASS